MSKKVTLTIQARAGRWDVVDAETWKIVSDGAKSLSFERAEDAAQAAIHVARRNGFEYLAPDTAEHHALMAERQGGVTLG